MTSVLVDQPPPRHADVERALGGLSEAEIRTLLRQVLPLLGFFDVRELHGPYEQGKDLLAWRESELGTKDWTGFVVKCGDVNAQVGATSGIRTVLQQVEQVLDHEVPDLLTSDTSHVRGCWVVTNGRILPNALADVVVTLRRHHLDKLVRWIDLTILTRLFNEKFPRLELERLLNLPPVQRE